MGKIKSSDLYENVVKNIHAAMISEDDNHLNGTYQIIKRYDVNSDIKKMIMEMLRLHDEFIKATVAKAVVSTLCDYNLIEKDMSINDKEATDKLLMSGTEKACKK